MSFTAADIMTRAGIALNDVGATRWTLPELCNWINEAQSAIALAKPSAYSVAVPLSLQQGVFQTIPDGYLSILRLTRNLANSVNVAMTDHAVSNAVATVYDFPSLNFGSEAPNRTVFVAIGLRNAVATPEILSVSIAGQLGTLVAAVFQAGCMAAVYSANVPTGTTGDVNVSLGETESHCGVGVWAAYGVGSTQFVTSTANPASSGNLPIGVGGGMFAYAIAADTAEVPLAVWDNISVDFDEMVDTGYVGQSGASTNVAGGNPIKTCTFPVDVVAKFAVFVLLNSSGLQAGGGRGIRPVNRDALEAQLPYWGDPSKTPFGKEVRHVIYDEMSPRNFYVYPGNDGTGTVEAILSKAPTPISATGDVDSINSYLTAIGLDDSYQAPMLDYVLYRALSKDDTASDMQQAQMHYQAFATALGVKVQNDQAESLNAQAGTSPS